MTDTTLDQRGEPGASQWVKRAVAVTFCLGLFAMLGVVFTRVIAARVPEQRATLEKLIAERTGLEVRFDDVRFAWNMDGASAVFTRVQLTDPAAGRVRVVAPELRVELDTWDFLRHQRFSLGHVTLSSPDIDIIGDADGSVLGSITPAQHSVASRRGATGTDEAALVRRYLSWAELMPTGRIEVEGARVHLKHRNERAAYHSFTLSQAVVSRGGETFSAYGTLLLSQDVGQSLFVSAKLDGLRPAGRVSGDLRFIARKIFLDRLSVAGLAGRGTLDARLKLRDGLVDSGSWQASARELRFDGDAGPHFDHVTLNGRLSREARDVLLELNDLQLTRDAQLERAPSLNARLGFDPATLRLVRTRVEAEHLPFMAAQLMTGLFAARLPDLPGATGGWSLTAGEVRDLQFDSDARDSAGWHLAARVEGADLVRGGDQARLVNLAARVDWNGDRLALAFDPASEASLQWATASSSRPLKLSGTLAIPAAGSWDFDALTASSGPATLGVDGSWHPDELHAAPLRVSLAQVDRAFVDDARLLLDASTPAPPLLSEIAGGNVTKGRLELLPAAEGGIAWDRSHGSLAFVDLATSGAQSAHLRAAQGTLEFARGVARLQLASGQVEDLAIADARVDWPRSGTPRLQASLQGDLDSPLLRDALHSQGLDRLRGTVQIESDARGERELKDPRLWRVTARLTDGSVTLGGGMPSVENLSGTLRYGSRQLRGVELAGGWLGGPVRIESRRPGTRGPLSLALNGVADAGPLLELLGSAGTVARVGGQLAWNGTLQPGSDGQWQISLASNLAGIESRLPAPFDKPRNRAVPLTAELTVGPDGIHDFSFESPRNFTIRGQVRGGATSARFEVQGLAGDLRRATGANAQPEVTVESLDVRRAPLVLAAAGELLPTDAALTIKVADLRAGASSLGGLHAALARRASGLAFTIESPGPDLHRLSAHGECGTEGRCRADFSADTAHLASLLRGGTLPPEWPLESLHASGTIDWPMTADDDFARLVAGSFDLATQGADHEHQLTGRATLADGQILFTDLQGTGPSADQVFRGTGRIDLVARGYDVTLDYERVALAATAVSSPTRARLARAWNAVRGSVVRRGWTEAPDTRRVQWHGSWD
jgi:hypothetical protein